MVQDTVRVLGYLTLGSRLKRIGERLQAETQVIFKLAGVGVATSLMPTLRALAQHGELTVGGLAEALGIAQPGVTRNVAQLKAAGLVQQVKRRGDQRIRMIALTRKGEELADRSMRDLEPQVLHAVAEICEGLSGPLLAQLDALEDALAAKPLHRRVHVSSPGGEA